MTISDDVIRIELAMQSILDTLLDHHTEVLTAAWATSWASVGGEIEAVLLELADGGDVPGWRIDRSRRAQQGLAAAGRALEDLAELTGATISEDAARAIGLGVDGEIAMIGTQLPPGYDRVVRVDDAQISAMLGRTTEQITAVSWPISAETLLAVQSELARGMIVGDNPREAARRMMQATEGRFTGGLTRALNISSTELLDAMRMAQHATDQVNADVLAGWTWLSHLDSATCISCISRHGSEYPIEEPGPLDHQRGRCARGPRTKSWADLGFPGISEPDLGMVDAGAWFEELTDTEQRSILGKSGHEAWASGRFPMDQWSVRKTTDGWRDSYVPAKPPKEA